MSLLYLNFVQAKSTFSMYAFHSVYEDWKDWTPRPLDCESSTPLLTAQLFNYSLDFGNKMLKSE